MAAPLTEERRRIILIWVAVCILIGVLVSFRGRFAPIFPSLKYGPSKDIGVYDADTSQPISGAEVRAEWRCGDYPLSNRSGSPNITLGTITDEGGRATLTIPRDLDESFECPMSVTISKSGYVPERILVCPTPGSFPDQGGDWPFRTTTLVAELPKDLTVVLSPAPPIYLSALSDNDPLIRTIAAEELGKLPVLEEEREEVIRALTNALDDQNPQVRESAARAIENLMCTEQ
ncbi:MAG: HEAT repeat domain-containing protein [Deltaproteobacteria bacterium]|nr:HEAT repeat domain-containing protein [Candidatus Zymogenaceae bacterium]